MTIQEAHITFKSLYDKVDSIAKPEFKREEIDLLLNISQERLVKKYYDGNNPQKKGFEVTEKRTDDLRNYVATSNVPLNSFLTSVSLFPVLTS